MDNLIAIFHNIRSAYNVGAMFRTADGMGVEKIYLTGYTPRPAGKKIFHPTAAQKMIAKTALSAEQKINWEYHRDIKTVLNSLKIQGIKIAAVEQAPQSVGYDKYKSQFPLALLVGNEVRGLDRRLLKSCDVVLEIPMRGSKESLNVSVAFGVAGYHVAGFLVS